MKKKDELEKNKTEADQDDVLSNDGMYDFITSLFGKNPLAKLLVSYLLTGKINEEDIKSLSQFFPMIEQYKTNESMANYVTSRTLEECVKYEITFWNEIDPITLVKQFNKFVDLHLNRLTSNEFILFGVSIANHLINQPHNRELLNHVVSSADSRGSYDSDILNSERENILQAIDQLIDDALRSLLDNKISESSADSRPASMHLLIRLILVLFILREFHLLNIIVKKESSDQSALGKILKIGLLTGFVIQLHLDDQSKDKLFNEIIRHPGLKDLYFSLKSSEAQQKRWESPKELKAEAVKKAKEEWEKGSPLLHTDMAKKLHEELIKKCPEERKNDFTVASVMRAIKSVAPKGKKLGITGAKKTYKSEKK